MGAIVSAERQRGCQRPAISNARNAYALGFIPCHSEGRCSTKSIHDIRYRSIMACKDGDGKKLSFGFHHHILVVQSTGSSRNSKTRGSPNLSFTPTSMVSGVN